MGRIITSHETATRRYLLELRTGLGLSGKSAELHLTERGRDLAATLVREERFDLWPARSPEFAAFTDGILPPEVFADYAEEMNFGNAALWDAWRGREPQMIGAAIGTPQVAIHIVCCEEDTTARNAVLLDDDKWGRFGPGTRRKCFATEQAADDAAAVVSVPVGWTAYGTTIWVKPSELAAPVAGGAA